MGLFGNNDRLNTARYNLEQYEKTKPADYQSKYQGQIKDVMDKLENMGDFDYDPDADAAYQQYKNQYTRQAKLANQNAQANAAAMTRTTLPTGPKAYSTKRTSTTTLTAQSRTGGRIL